MLPGIGTLWTLSTAVLDSPEPITSAELTHRHILKFYSPLALSWIFMAVESPIALSVISRMPNAEICRAAFQPLMALAYLIESPVIDLLTTATTLGKDRKHYVQLSRFVWWIMRRKWKPLESRWRSALAMAPNSKRRWKSLESSTSPC